ncbi:ribonuclease E/G [Novispirillum sp. DQ9]|uniref:ribonuclease E/G n=1 Tax=Novispirillum sp. DQ9 TaxID=3398612 RepID=UPI003C7BEFB5
MRPDTALIDRSPGLTRVALLARGGVWEVHLFPDHLPLPGDLWLGRLKARVPGSAAAFVDLGTGPDGFLPAEDMPGGLPPDGSAVLVEIAQAKRPGKGPKLTGAVSLGGVHLVYTPLRAGVSLSSRLTHKTERKRLTAWAEGAVSEGEGVVLRTAAFQVSEAELNAALAEGRAAWAEVQAAVKTAKPPCRIRGGQAPLAAALSGRAVDRVLCEGHALAEEARRARPDLADAVRVCGAGIFAEEGVSEALDSALARRVPLPGGGALTIETTAAATLIDVDSGRSGEAAANAAAVSEIARQMRLRGLAGAIVIDFAAPPKGAMAAKRALADSLAQVLADDPARPQVVGVSGLGLVEVRRDRLRPPLADLLLAPAQPAPPSSVALAFDALRRVVEEARAVPGSRPALTVGAAVAAVLRGPLAPAVAEAERTLGHPLTITETEKR